MSGFVLGLDGGGTQTRTVGADFSGQALGTGLSGPCNLAAVSPAEALAAALAAADTALEQAQKSRTDVMAVCAGVAGVSYTDRRAHFLSGLQDAFANAQVSVEPDYAIALTGATGGGPGVIVIAGTGSAAYGENLAGETHRTGAYGYLIDDSGSGYGVGRATLAAVLQAADGTGPQTTLTERILAGLGLASLSEVVPGVYGGSISRVTIASLSQAVAEAASDDNDAVARAILLRAGGALAQLVHGITQRLFAEQSAVFPVVQIGGLWNAGDALTDVFTRSLRRFAPGAVITPPLHSPVEGAVQRALAQIGTIQKSSAPS
jgi:N-acetylglucosamine kinase-like BadF-type ATPase